MPYIYILKVFLISLMLNFSSLSFATDTNDQAMCKQKVENKYNIAKQKLDNKKNQISNNKKRVDKNIQRLRSRLKAVKNTTEKQTLTSKLEILKQKKQKMKRNIKKVEAKHNELLMKRTAKIDECKNNKGLMLKTSEESCSVKSDCLSYCYTKACGGESSTCDPGDDESIYASANCENRSCKCN